MRNEYKTYLLQAFLFITTIITTTLAGMEWMGLGEFTWDNFFQGFLYSIPFLGILTVHEFGHYITARIYKISVTLPYYIPFFIPLLTSIGTFGAFIRIKSPLHTKKMIFDVGIAGPLAGFVVALGVLYYGFTHLPPQEYVLKVHPEYKEFGYGLNYEKHVYTYEFSRKMDSVAHAEAKLSWKAQPEYPTIKVGKNILFWLFEEYVADQPERIPNEYEMFHYPFLFAGYLALFFTALNLIPIGQLDGGHILYGLIGSRRHKVVSIALFITMVYLAGVGLFKNNLITGNALTSVDNLMIFGPIYLFFLYFIFGKLSPNWTTNLMIAVSVFAAQYFTELAFPSFTGIGGFFLIFGVLLGRVLGVVHPPALIEEPLSTSRKVLGWITLIIFILCFTPFPLATEVIRP